MGRYKIQLISFFILSPISDKEMHYIIVVCIKIQTVNSLEYVADMC